MFALWLIAVVLSVPSWAQEPTSDPPADPLPSPLPAPVPPSDALVGWLDGLVWMPMGPPGGRDLVDVAIAPDDVARLAVVDRPGGVWVSTDGGLSWREALAPAGSRLGDASGREAALLDAETRLDELTSGLDLDEPGVVDDADLEEVLDEQDDALGQALDAAIDELAADALQSDWFGQTQASDTPTRTHVSIWWTRAGGLLAGRADGLWRSTDEGITWRRVGPATVALVALPGGRAVIGGPDGLAWSDDMDRWTSVPGRTAPVRDLTAGAMGVLAASDDGPWLSTDGESWSPFGLVTTPFDLVRVDPLQPGAVWLADVDGIVRTQDGGRSFVTPAGPPLTDPRDIVVDAGGVVLVAADDGAWLSRDGGGSFGLLDGGLGPVDGRAVAAVGRTVVFVTDQGLYRLEEAPERVGRAADAGFAPLGALLAAADHRVGLDVGRRPSGPGGQALAWAVPSVAVEVRWQRNDGFASRLDAGRTAGVDGNASIYGFLTWQPPTRGSADPDAQQVVVQETPEGMQYYAGDFDQWMMLGSVGRRVTDARMASTARIAELYAERARLVGDRGRDDPTVRTKVLRELRIAEVEAWLDALTDGAVSRYRLGAPQGGGS